MNKFTFSHLFTAVSLLALLFLVLAAWLIRASWFDPLFESTNLTTANINAKSDIAFNDPLITTVPEDQQGGERKTKVFISTLDPVLGERTARVYVILYGSLLDADMAAYLGMISDLDSTYDADVAFVWKDNPTSDAEVLAAKVAHCANEYNKFWEFTDVLDTRIDDSEDALIAIAESLSLDGQTMRDCVATAGYNGQITQSQAAAANLGITNSHSLFINDRLLTEPATVADIKQHIDEVLATY